MQHDLKKFLNASLQKKPSQNGSDNTKTHENHSHSSTNKSSKNGLSDFLFCKQESTALKIWLSSFVSNKKLQKLKSAQDIRSLLTLSISEMDEKINHCLNQIIHHSRFQSLEASWRSLHLFVTEASGHHRQIKVKIFNASWLEITKDIDKAAEFDQSQLFAKVYSHEYGMPGGEPFSILLGDYYITHKPSKTNPRDISTLKGISQTAAAAFCPFITSASPSLFELDEFTDIHADLNLNLYFENSQFSQWHSLRQTPDSRFIGLTLPRVLIREPYHTHQDQYKGIRFRENIESHSDYLWGNACYAFGSIILKEFAAVGWFSQIRGTPRDLDSGGLVTYLPNSSLSPKTTPHLTRPPIEMSIGYRLEKEFSEKGFIPLSHCHNTSLIAFYSNQSIKATEQSTQEDSRQTLHINTMIQHVLSASRFAHYIKVMIRDKIGGFTSANECEHFLNQWLLKYQVGNDSVEWDQQAKYPLKSGRVKVREVPGKPGHYYSIIYLQPHYQVDQVISELKLTTELSNITGQ